MKESVVRFNYSVHKTHFADHHFISMISFLPFSTPLDLEQATEEKLGRLPCESKRGGTNARHVYLRKDGKVHEVSIT